ncbi:MAG: carboxylating nicotinate-nucleotide diphosphorylase [Planctomycetes bacterium]|nr:carboxylating nicotinate-nucleotide diphosphorylase [Planctomycetota bacterium]
MNTTSTFEIGPDEIATLNRLIQAGLDEDLAQAGDCTSQALVPAALQGVARLVARQQGSVAGLEASRAVLFTLGQLCERCRAPMVLRPGRDGEFLGCSDSANCGNRKAVAAGEGIRWESCCGDGTRLEPGQVIARVSGCLRVLLACERLALNFLQRLSGVATLTRRFVDAVAGLPCRIYDTRKTTPGWRALEKYAVRVGGGFNHRMGLHDAVLIKDNHLVAWRIQVGTETLADAVRAARAAVPAGTVVELEVDSVPQLEEALSGQPDIVLLDNMPLDQLHQAVTIRNRQRPRLLLEASGGITLDTVREVAESGVDRISIGALTHSAPALDIALDFDEWAR